MEIDVLAMIYSKIQLETRRRCHVLMSRFYANMSR